MGDGVQHGQRPFHVIEYFFSSSLQVMNENLYELERCLQSTSKKLTANVGDKNGWPWKYNEKQVGIKQI